MAGLVLGAGVRGRVGGSGQGQGKSEGEGEESGWGLLRTVRLGQSWSTLRGWLVDGSVCLLLSHSAIAS